jgi:hypothetical protein
VEERRCRRDLRDPGRVGDLRATQAARTALAVPLLVDVQQPGDDAGSETHPLGGVRRDLAVRAAVALHDLARADRRRARRGDARDQARRRCEMRQVGPQHVARTRELGADGGALDRELVAAEHPRRLMRVCGAAHVLQQRRVVDVARIGRGSHAGELHRHQRRTARLARVEPHPDIGHQRQAREQLRQAQRSH